MPTPGTLNVILHGTFTFIERDRKIFAIIPKIDSHVFRAGNWLAETELLKGTYELRGTNAGRDTFNDSRNMILTFRDALASDLIHATLIFEPPEKLTSLRVARVPRTSFRIPKEPDRILNAKQLARVLNPRKKSDQIATLQIFTYTFEDDGGLRLATLTAGEQKALRLAGLPQTQQRRDEVLGHYWEPVLTGGFINLHIFSAEDHPGNPTHVSNAFEQSAAVLGVPLTLSRVHPAGEIDENDLPDGVIAEETEDLGPRMKRMARLGRLLRQKGDPGQAWHENDALDGNPSACGGLKGGP